jgi:hypothetical protein
MLSLNTIFYHTIGTEPDLFAPTASSRTCEEITADDLVHDLGCTAGDVGETRVDIGRGRSGTHPSELHVAKRLLPWADHVGVFIWR